MQLLITAALGGVHTGAATLLRRLGKKATGAGARDGTVYGRPPTAAKAFGCHHLRAISISIATAVAHAIAQWGDAAADQLLSTARPHTDAY